MVDLIPPPRRHAAHSHFGTPDFSSLGALVYPEYFSTAKSEHEMRFMEARALAEAIRKGDRKKAAAFGALVTRADVERIFLHRAGGFRMSILTRYYLGSEVMVEVPYDSTGGNHSPRNRVNGAIRVYRGYPHVH